MAHPSEVAGVVIVEGKAGGAGDAVIDIRAVAGLAQLVAGVLRGELRSWVMGAYSRSGRFRPGYL